MTIIVYPADAIATVPTYTGRMAREAHSVFMAGATTADPFGVRSGVRPGTSPTTVTATSTTWTIGAHAGALDMETAVEASGYEYSVNATGGLPTGAVTAADATRPRVDIVWLRLDDPAESDGSSAPAVVAGYTAGAPLAIPVAPATPARCMVLATIQVPMSGGGAPTVIWVAPYTVAAGGILPVPAGVYPATPYVGQYVDDAVAGLLRWNGTSWSASGYVTKAAVTATVGGITTTTFTSLIGVTVTGDGVKRFKITGSVPLMTSTVAGDGFDLRLYESNSGTTIKKARAIVVTVGGGINGPGMTLVGTDVPAAGSRTYILQVCRSVGSGSGSVYADATGFSIEILVEQI